MLMVVVLCAADAGAQTWRGFYVGGRLGTRIAGLVEHVHTYEHFDGARCRRCSP
jgi:hypothetical protein